MLCVQHWARYRSHFAIILNITFTLRCFLKVIIYNVKQILLFLFYKRVSKSLNDLLRSVRKIAEDKGKQCHTYSFRLCPYILRRRLRFLTEMPPRELSFLLDIQGHMYFYIQGIWVIWARSLTSLGLNLLVSEIRRCGSNDALDLF